MQQRALSHLVQAPRDLDYVGSFQALSRVHLELRKLGPSPERLLRRAQLERAVGNHAASLAAAQDALLLQPQAGEMHYQVGIAYLFLALAKAGVLPVGPSASELPYEGVGALLQRARDAFARAHASNAADEDAAQDHAILDALLEGGPSDLVLTRKLRQARP